MGTRFLAAGAVLLVAAGGLSAADPSDPNIQRAIKGGRAYLHEVFKPGGRGFGTSRYGPTSPVPRLEGAPAHDPQNTIGYFSLAGLALLEAGAVPGSDAVLNIVAAVRDGALRTHGTYEVSLAIMFLDRLGSKDDIPLIQLLTLRLMSGQRQSGAWTYTCEGLRLDPVQARQLRSEFKNHRLVSGSGGSRPDGKAGGGGTAPRKDLDDRKADAPPEPPKEDRERAGGLHPAVEKLIKQAAEAPPKEFDQRTPDHSNTQFATVGLWIGRRHGVDTTASLRRLDEYYRKCQQGDGGWGYNGSDGSTPSMTCAGLMGLALGFGAKNLPDGTDKPPRVADPEAMNKDPKVEAALKRLGTFVVEAERTKIDATAAFADLSRDTYFLWSLERVGVVFGLKTIGDVNWYDWGSAHLIERQKPDGSWVNESRHGGLTEAHTSLALLFLCRANLTEDLTTSLRGKMKDPGSHRLVGGKGGIDGILQGGKRGSPELPREPERTGTLKTPSQPRGDLPPVRADGPAAKGAGSATDKDPLAAALLAAAPAERAELIAKYRDTPGIQYTDALARAAAKLTGEAQAQVRDALAERLTRMKTATLTELMVYPDRELRRAAALAAAGKGKDRLAEYADSLIKLVGDKDPMVSQAARLALKTLTDQDFGPDGEAADRAAAQAAWQKWWGDQKK